MSDFEKLVLHVWDLGIIALCVGITILIARDLASKPKPKDTP